MANQTSPIQINDSTPETMKYLVGLGEEAQAAKRNVPETIKIEGSTYYVGRDGGLIRIEEVDPHKPATTEFFSLRGLVDFILSDVDHMFADDQRRFIVRVISPEKVQILSPLTGVENVRHTVAYCEAKVPGIAFDRFMDTESLNIMLLTKFAANDNRNGVMALVGNIEAEEGVTTADDGVSQRVVSKKAIKTGGVAVVQNPVYLIPFRTFPEVSQPETPFVLRLRGDKDNVEAAVYEADGGAWKIQAVRNIAEWLVAQLDGVNVEVMA